MYETLRRIGKYVRDMTPIQIVFLIILAAIALFGLFLLIALLRLGRSGQNLNAPELGVDGGNLSPCPQTPNCISTQAPLEAGDHHAEPIVLNDSAAEVFSRIRGWIDSQPRARVAEADDPRYLRAEFRSPLFGFVDDLELLAVQEEEHKLVLHVRSAARVGRGDMGVNRKRYNALRGAVGG